MTTGAETLAFAIATCITASAIGLLCGFIRLRIELYRDMPGMMPMMGRFGRKLGGTSI